MNKITKKTFVEALTNNTSVLVGSVINKTDEIVKNAIEGIKSINTTITRTGVLKGNYIRFDVSNGSVSSLALNDAGKHEYFEQNTNSGKYLIQKTTQQNDYGCEIKEDICYCVYAII